MTTDDRIEDRNLRDVVPLVSPREVKRRLPLTDRAERLVLDTRAAIRAILHGADPHRLLVVVGPCSIHDPSVALDYAHRLKRVADDVADHLLIVMRTYFEKPRTTVGWKGLINDPRLDGSCDIGAGLELARSILLDVTRIGVPCASELLDPITPQYVGDLVSWAAIGARTTESQTHREMASGLSMPVGFKNGTDGGLEVALNAMVSAREPHSFVGITADGATAIIKTKGNPDRHIVLRGGGGRPNYAPEDVARALAMVGSQNISRPIMIDCSHDNSRRDHTRQPAVLRDVLDQVHAGRNEIMGVMIESNIYAGKQTWKPQIEPDYGISITDACIGWDDTERLLEETAIAVASRGPRRTAA